jgi:hypothetical protein
MTDIPNSLNKLIFNGENKLDIYPSYVYEPDQESIAIYDVINDVFIRKNNLPRWQLLPSPIKLVKTFEYENNTVLFFKITGIYACVTSLDELIRQYYFLDQSIFNQCIDQLLTSKKYQLVNNPPMEKVCKIADFCPLCEPKIFDRIDKWYNHGLWRIIKEKGIEYDCDVFLSFSESNKLVPPIKDLVTTAEDFGINNDLYCCDTCCSDKNYSGSDIYHCLDCYKTDDPFNVCFDCYEQNKQCEHEKTFNHKIGKFCDNIDLLSKW